MEHATESLERAEHAAHPTHQGGPLSMLVGLTMALLGVILAFASAKVGGERTELVKALVEQQHAHAKYQAQDIKHRTASLALRQLHATRDAAKLDGDDMLEVARNVDRYLGESRAANEWVESFNPAIVAHTEAQEEYEHAQLAAEFGIVVASIALLLRRREPWIVSILLGITAIGILVVTYSHVGKIVHTAEEEIEKNARAYRELRLAGKKADSDQRLVDEVRAIYGQKRDAPATP